MASFKTVSALINSMDIGDVFQLSAPDKSCGTDVLTALKNRQSTRQYVSGGLTEQEISNILWAAQGVNRAEGNMRTSPTALNKQEIIIHVFSTSGIAIYDPIAHTLKKVASDDYRALLSHGQDYVMQASLVLLFTVDFNLFGDMKDQVRLFGAADAGIASENVNIYCAAVGLGTITRSTVPSAELSQLLGLKEDQVPLLNNPIGRK